MFKLVSSGLVALNQVGGFAIALSFMLLGGALLGNAIFWRIHAVRVQGILLGFRQQGNMLRCVYRYALPSGATTRRPRMKGRAGHTVEPRGRACRCW
jgi:hypothetical protein